MYVHIIISVLGILMLFCSTAVDGADWTQWRGKDRDGRVPASPSTNWGEKPHLVWKLEIGEGHSSPVSYKNRVYVHSRQNDDEVVTCLSLTSGEVIWQQSYAAPYKMNSAAYAHGKGPKSTPLAHQGHLYTFGISGLLSCFDLESGRLSWRVNSKDEFDETSPLYGTAMSPVASGDLVVAHLGGENDGALRAFDSETGRVIWSWTGDGPGYASPLLVTLEGVQQVVTQSQDNIIGIDLSNGGELWRIPFTTPWQQNVVTPVVHGELVILSGLDNGTFAIKLTRTGDRWSTEKVWSRKDVSMYMSSPVIGGSRLFGLSHYKRGQLFCLNPQSGELLWKGDGRQGDYAGLLLSDKMLFALNTDGEFMVIENTGEGYRQVAVHTVADSPTWAYPVILGSQLLVKDFSSIALWDF
jgi:outer membrane protein assembly factor BamB